MHVANSATKSNTHKNKKAAWMMGVDGARGSSLGEVFKDVDMSLCQCA